MNKTLTHALAAALAVGATAASADILHLDDVIIDGSLCVGFDCVNGEAFGADTIRLKENNLRINAEDTSVGSFPSNDWRLTFNDSASGGANKFSVDDVTGARTPFTIEAGARTNALYVEADGDIGVGTSNPVVDVHVVTGNTPTLRLEQDGSSGFAPQTWDLAGNETNFFLRDVTNGSKLPIRVRPNAPTSSIDIEGTTGDVGIGTASPSAPLHVVRSNDTASIRVQDTDATIDTNPQQMLSLENNGALLFRLSDTSNSANVWDFQNQNGGFIVSKLATGGPEFLIRSNGQVEMGPGAVTNFTLSPTGNLTIAGTLTTAGAVYPDYVFKPEYQLRPLDELATFIQENGHLPNVPSEQDVAARGGINMSDLQVALLEKVEELTLYTLEQHHTIRQLQERLSTLESEAK